MTPPSTRRGPRTHRRRGPGGLVWLGAVTVLALGSCSDPGRPATAAPGSGGAASAGSPAGAAGPPGAGLAPPRGIPVPGPDHPGALNPDVTQATLPTTACRKGWTRTVRPPAAVTDAIKRRQLAAAASPYRTSQVEEDHLVPLELGGQPVALGADGLPAAAQPNLWPEPRDAVVGTGHGAESKDAVELYLNRAVCGGRMALADAQARILTWWTELAAAGAAGSNEPPGLAP